MHQPHHHAEIPPIQSETLFERPLSTSAAPSTAGTASATRPQSQVQAETQRPGDPHINEHEEELLRVEQSPFEHESSPSREASAIPTRKKKGHSCPFCDKEFSRNSTLARHVQNHRGEKEFKCSTCPRAFHRRDLLRRHAALHDSGERYVCGTSLCAARLNLEKEVLAWGCGRRFARQDELTRHFQGKKGQTCATPMRVALQSAGTWLEWCDPTKLASICYVNGEKPSLFS